MTDREFTQWLDDEVAGNRITRLQQQDLLQQKRTFENQRTLIEQDYRNQIVGFVADQLRVSRDIHELISMCKEQYPKRMIYFEPIGFYLL